MQLFSLSDLHRRIRQVVALNFAEPLWITAEIAQVKSARGHFYLELVQKGGDDILAQGQAVLWARDYQRLRRALGPTLEALLREGLEVKMRARVDFHERYGLKLLVDDFDPAYTLGQLELQRRQTVQTLRAGGLLERNRALPLPTVLQRIAVVSSEGAAGFQDFREQLAANAFGYAFACELFTSAVQGANVAAEMQAAFDSIRYRAAAFDAVVILRGGGGRLDLAAFDQLELCRAAAEMPLPVLTGIGHDADETVLDLVAHTALKTPTAVADFLLQHQLFFENKLLRLAEQLRNTADDHLKINTLELERLETALHWSSRERLRTAGQRLVFLEKNLPPLVQNLLRTHARQLTQAEALCTALHPDAALRRGFSLTLKNGRVINSPQEITPGDLLETRMRDGVILSTALDNP